LYDDRQLLKLDGAIDLPLLPVADDEAAPLELNIRRQMSCNVVVKGAGRGATFSKSLTKRKRRILCVRRRHWRMLFMKHVLPMLENPNSSSETAAVASARDDDMSTRAAGRDALGAPDVRGSSDRALTIVLLLLLLSRTLDLNLDAYLLSEAAGGG
jgi:hypothetical protein